MIDNSIATHFVTVILHGVMVIMSLIALPDTSEAQISPDRHSYLVPEEMDAIAAGVLRDHAEEKARIGPVGVELVRILDAGIFLTETGEQTVDIFHFGRRWQHLRTFGKYGEGPGDFRTVWDLFVLGEVLYVVDNAQRRITGFEGFDPPSQIQLRETFSFAGEWMNTIHSAEAVGEERVLFSGRGAAFSEDIVKGRDESCAVFLAQKQEGFEQERCIVEYPPHIMAAEGASMVARQNRVMMRRGASGDVYVWFTHAPHIVRVEPNDLSTEVIEIESSFYAAPEHVHYTDVASREELRRWQSEHYTVSHVTETEKHLVVQYESRDGEDLESYTRLVIIDRDTEAAVGMLRLDDPSLRLYDAVGAHELLLVQFEENDTVLATIDVRDLTADLSE